jgi:hypothetical protein
MPSIADYDGTEGHWLTVSRRQAGMTSIRPARPLYGTTGRCSCGAWNGKSNEAPSKGGRKWMVEAHRTHVAQIAERAD